jgi:pentose-5-phosphate-3-epimerase
VKKLIEGKIFTVHVDDNYPDYHGYLSDKPDINTQVFSPAFVGSLNKSVRSGGRFLNLHLLTDNPLQRLREYDQFNLGAVCFQLDVISKARQLEKLVDTIVRTDACASPVVETVGSENLTPPSIGEVETLLEPVSSKVGMLTFQVAGTAARSSQKAGAFEGHVLRDYVSSARRIFGGTLQFQGGIKRDTIGDAVRLGAEFLVTGTEIFRNRDWHSPAQVIDQMAVHAARALQQVTY